MIAFAGDTGAVAAAHASGSWHTGQRQVKPLNTSAGFSGFAVVSSSPAWAVGVGGAITHTSNGGTTWTTESIGTTRDPWGVTFQSATLGFAGGVDGALLQFAGTPIPVPGATPLGLGALILLLAWGVRRRTVRGVSAQEVAARFKHRLGLGPRLRTRAARTSRLRGGRPRGPRPPSGGQTAPSPTSPGWSGHRCSLSRAVAHPRAGSPRMARSLAASVDAKIPRATFMRWPSRTTTMPGLSSAPASRLPSMTVEAPAPMALAASAAKRTPPSAMTGTPRRWETWALSSTAVS